MVRTWILCLLIALSISRLDTYYRYKDGTLLFNNKEIKVEGVFAYDSKNYGGALSSINLTSMIVHTILFSSVGDNIISKSTINQIAGEANFNGISQLISGTIAVTERDDEVVLSLNRTNTADRDSWNCSIKGKASPKLFYDYEEAGLRAKRLIGMSSEFFEGPVIIGYATVDISYFFYDCSAVRKKFITVGNEAKPGYIIMGNDEKHCGILDNEGDKFVHDNALKVVDTPLILASQFFPNGYYFMKYPNWMPGIY